MHSEVLGLGQKMEEKIEFPDAYVHGSFSPSDEAVELLFGELSWERYTAKGRCRPGPS